MRGASRSGPPIIHDVLRSPGQPLDRAALAYFEPRFNPDFGSVRVHSGAEAGASARAGNALAYTVSRDVVFGAGQYVPASSEGRKLLAHELAHVVQQTNMVQASRSDLTIGPANSAVEQEAARIAQRVHDTERGRLEVKSVPQSLQREVTTDDCEALESEVKSAHGKAMDMTGKAPKLLKSYDGTNPKSVGDALRQHFHTTDLRDAQNISI
jgi:hypothetical protein